MPRVLDILVLCANTSTIKNYKALRILRSFCQSAFDKIPICKYAENINIYYAGIDIQNTVLSTLTSLPEYNITPNSIIIPNNINENPINIDHIVLPANLGDLKNPEIQEIFPKFFDIIINENCPRTANGIGLNPKHLFSILNSCLKLNGIYIDKVAAIETFGNNGFNIIYDPKKSGDGLLTKLTQTVVISYEKSPSDWIGFKLNSEIDRNELIEKLAQGIFNKRSKTNKRSKRHKRNKRSKTHKRHKRHKRSKRSKRHKRDKRHKKK